MRRNSLLLLVGAVAALAAACRDNSVVAPARSALSPSATSFSKSDRDSDQNVFGTIQLSPAGGTYHVGAFDLILPPGAVCDPATTKYGVGHWNDDCIAASQSVTVNLVAKKHAGEVSVDFQPDIRFRPAAGAVILQTGAYADQLTSASIRQLPASSVFFQSFVILYVPTGSVSRIDEVRSTGDAAFLTHVDRQTGLVWRQIKHFSGYLITAGQKCDTSSPDATQCTVDTGLGGTGTATIDTALLFTSVDTTSTSASVIVSP